MVNFFIFLFFQYYLYILFVFALCYLVWFLFLYNLSLQLSYYGFVWMVSNRCLVMAQHFHAWFYVCLATPNYQAKIFLQNTSFEQNITDHVLYTMCENFL